MHKQLLILVRILVLHYIFFTICYSQQDTLNNNRRKEVQARIDLINQLIKEKGYKWKAGFNSLSYYDDYQLAKLCGEKSEASKVELNLIKQDSMYLDYISQSNKLLQILSVPNWKSLMITPELQDTGCKNCWAYASTGVAEGLLHNYLGYNADLNLNEDSLTTYGCDGCDGGAASCGLALIKNRGIPSKVGINSGWYYDNARYKIASYSVQAPTNINSIKTALANSPVYASMYVYWDFYYVVNDPEYIYQHTWGDYVGSHAVVIIGYNDDEEYWLCKNSWGTGWGNQGYFKIAYGECGIDIINCGTATVNQSSLAKIIPTVIPSLSTALSYSFGSGEYAYVIGYNSLTSNPNPIPYNGVLLVKNGATINLNNFQLLVSGNMYNQWGQIIIENGGSILHSAKLKKNGLDRIIGYFPYTFINDYTISSGYEMTVNPGSLIKFYTNKKLIVQGSLISIGTSSNTITLTRDGISGNWGGIQFNSGSSGTLDFCNITYATTGINMYNSSPTIKHSTIDNNSSVGVYCDYYSSPILVGNNIRNNSSYGLRCNSYSSPNLTDYGYPGSNVIRNNLNGVYTSYNCNPSLNGYLTYGNSVFNNTNQEVVAYYNSIVNANKVYWGTTFPPPDAEFYASSSTINRNDPLQTNPNPNRNIIPTNYDNKTPIHATMSIQFDELELAEQKQREGKHDEAINLFLEVFKKETNTNRGRYALIKIEECFTQAKKKDFLDFSKKELKPLLKEENELFVVLLELETHQLYNLGFGNQAMNNLKMILYKYNLNEAIEKQTLYRIGAYYLDLYNDKLNAQKTFDDLAAKYPEDELLTYANLMLNEDRYNTQSAKNIDQQMIAVEETKEVFNNYPNPFNPTTTITFTLLTKENIKLKIFDVLGREVAILVDGEFEMGKHEITFDASKLPSGVYFYNLTTNGNSLTKKMLLLK